MLLVLGPWNVLYANIQIVESCMERRLHYPQNQLPLNSYRELHMRQSPYFIHNQESVQRQIEGGVLFLLLFIRGSNRWGALTRDHGHGGFKQEIDILSQFWKSEIQGQQGPAPSEALAKNLGLHLPGFWRLPSNWQCSLASVIWSPPVSSNDLPPCVSRCLCVLISIFSLMKTSVFGFRACSHLVWFTLSNYIYKDLSKYNLFLNFLVEAHSCWTQFNLYPLVQPYT